MRNGKPDYTLRVSRELLDKLRYVAKYEDRTTNKELERLIKIHVANFEKKNGPIKLEDIKLLKNKN